MKAMSSPRFFAIYSGVLTLMFAVTVLCGFAMMRNPNLGIITARRINIVEPDGTVRLTISNRCDHGRPSSRIFLISSQSKAGRPGFSLANCRARSRRRSNAACT